MPEPRFAPALSNLELFHQGKTRDTFLTLSDKHLLVVATDRLSTHNVVHLSTIPRKGEVLTALTIYWAKKLLDQANIPHHLVAYGPEIYNYLPGKKSDYPEDLQYRAIVVKKLKMVPVEFIFRSYLASSGSLYKKYYSKGKPNPYGIELEPGLPVMHPFNPPIFTPTDKSETDEPLNTEETKAKYPKEMGEAAITYLLLGKYLRDVCHIELVDSKFEVGVDEDGLVCVADEIVTPDSSRFCECSKIQTGVEPPYLDKQIARDKAEKIWGDGPQVPLEFESATTEQLSRIYLDLVTNITRSSLYIFQLNNMDMSV